MLSRLRTEFRYRLQYPSEYRLGLMRAGLRRSLNSGAAPLRFLIVSDGLALSSEPQFDPLWRHAGALRDRLGTVFHRMRLSDAMRLGRSALSRFDAVGLKLTFRTPDDEAVRTVAHFRDRTSGPGAKLVYFDGDDDACVQWPEALRGVDLYVKKGVFAADEDYFREFAGKTNLTDYVSKSRGGPVPTDIPKSGVLRPADLSKLHLGWSLALDDRHVELFEEFKPPPASKKDVDVVCRAGLPNDWSAALRNTVSSQLEPLRDRRRLMVSIDSGRVPRRDYCDELLRGRICVSPFGYGEVCGRDIEATLCGCLLVKPDMGHLRSHPDIFVPGVTYVPVRWDYADLAETCEHYLDREDDRARIAGNAYRALAESYGADAFVEMFAGVLDRLGLISAGLASRAASSL
jgi:hypothetical protein